MKNIKVKTGVYTLTTVKEDGSEFEESKDFSFFLDMRTSMKMQFINSVVSLVVGESYYPVLKDIMFDIMLINYFTDIDVKEILSSNNAVDEIEDYLSRTNAVEIIKSNVSQELLNELSQGIDFDIEYKTGVHCNDITTAVKSLIHTLEDKVSNVDTEGMMDLATKLSGMTGDLTPDSIVEAYAKTDNFTGNQALVIEEKNKQIVELTELLKMKNQSNKTANK